jgi:hypothetical protein
VIGYGNKNKDKNKVRIRKEELRTDGISKLRIYSIRNLKAIPLKAGRKGGFRGSLD